MISHPCRARGKAGSAPLRRGLAPLAPLRDRRMMHGPAENFVLAGFHADLCRPSWRNAPVRRGACHAAESFRRIAPSCFRTDTPGPDGS